ncbi:DUF3368 domain-containing protein [Candidatus Pacearchaeota archaeon]|nr:DUF3368 domain-containing protein [Candidatus Pacearchaeota archaeon]
MEIVSNISSIIFLAKLNIFHLVKNKFSKILVSKEVFDEISAKQSPETNVIKRELNNFIEIIKLKKIKELPLDYGERAAISLCLEKNLGFLSDDKVARNYARSLGIEVIGVLGVIIWNFENKKLTKLETLKLINDLLKNDFYISANLYSEIIDYTNSFD